MCYCHTGRNELLSLTWVPWKPLGWLPGETSVFLKEVRASLLPWMVRCGDSMADEYGRGGRRYRAVSSGKT